MREQQPQIESVKKPPSSSVELRRAAIAALARCATKSPALRHHVAEPAAVLGQHHSQRSSHNMLNHWPFKERVGIVVGGVRRDNDLPPSRRNQFFDAGGVDSPSNAGKTHDPLRVRLFDKCFGVVPSWQLTGF
jgi:hypothetical protein